MNQHLSGHLHTSWPTFLFAKLLSKEELQISDAEAAVTGKSKKKKKLDTKEHKHNWTDGPIKNVKAFSCYIWTVVRLRREQTKSEVWTKTEVWTEGHQKEVKSNHSDAPFTINFFDRRN